MMSLLRITIVVFKKYAQVFAVFLAFALMVIFSYSFTSKKERVNLQDKVKDAISQTEANIKAELKEPETLLAGVSETLRAMLFDNRDADTVQGFIDHIDNYVQSESDKRMLGVIGFYAVFDVFDGKFMTGIKTWEKPENFNPLNLPWYTEAVKADGDIAITQPEVDTSTGKVSLSFSRRIFDDERHPLGVIALGIYLDKIKQEAINTRFTKDGYGFLLDDETEVIVHPEPWMLGLLLNEVKSNIAAYSDELRRNGSVSEAVTADYRGIQSIVFMQRLYNGWYMGVVTPRANYYQSTKHLAVILSAFGVVFAVLLGWMLLTISAGKAASDERIQLMSDSNPIGMSFWDGNLHIIDCNNTTLEMFGLSSKNEYFQMFDELSPGRQPDGSISNIKCYELLREAMETGFLRFEWVHQKPDGEPIPCEMTLIRTKYKKDFTIMAYVRDLREQKRIMKMMEWRTHLLDMVNSAATILLSSNNADSLNPQ